MSGRLAKAAKMFECLRQSIFANKSLSVDTRRCVYLATVVATLLYGIETWAVKARQVRQLEVFHNRCVRGIMGVTLLQQWKDRITSKSLTMEFGMPDGINALVIQRHLQWLGHVGRMSDDRLPKQLLFGELLATRPAHGPKLRWRDVVLGDIQRMGFDALSWFSAAQDRSGWFDACQSILSGSALSAVGPSWMLALSSVAVEGFSIDVGT